MLRLLAEEFWAQQLSIDVCNASRRK